MAPKEMVTELGGGFIIVAGGGKPSAILAPRVAATGVVGMMTPSSVNARDESELKAWMSEWGFGGAGVQQVDQVHGSAVLRSNSSASSPGLREADGLWSDENDVALAIKAADCAPVWLVDHRSHRFALIHAGWRGVASEVVASAVGALAAQGTKPEELIAAIGPHLRPCCFEVGPEVAELFGEVKGAVLPASRLAAERRRDDSSSLDLSAAILAKLDVLDVRKEQVFAATACTRCNPQFFHSYRRNGAGGPLMAAVAVRKP